VLQAIIDISEGKSTEPVIDALHLQIESLQDDLGNNVEALNWFNLSRPASSAPLTPPPSVLRPILLPGESIHYNFNPLYNDFLHDRRAHLSSTIMLRLSYLPHHIVLRNKFGSFFAFPICQAQSPG
jgi:hypothetical protein